MVSVVLGVYNGEPFVEETLESVFAQTYSDYEIVVVDDGSTDATPEILAKFQTRGVRVIHHSKNRGIAAGVNSAMKAVRGKYTAFVDHDDPWYPEKLQCQIELFKIAPWIDFCFTNCVVFGDVEKEHTVFEERNSAVRKYAAQEIGPNMFEITEESFLVALCEVQFPPFCPMIRTEAVRRVLPLDEDVAAQDVQLVFRIANQVKVGYVDRALWRRRVRRASWGNTMGMLRWIEAHIKTLERLPRWTKLSEKEKASVEKLLLGYLRAGGYAALDEGLTGKARGYYWESLRREPSARDALYWLSAYLSPPLRSYLRAMKQKLFGRLDVLNR